MGKQKLAPLSDYGRLLTQVKDRIRHAQARAVFAANAELIRLYWDIGRLLAERQAEKGWGAAVIPRLARDLHNELPEVEGFSERNIKRMLGFYRAYREPSAIVPQPVAQIPPDSKVPQPVAQMRAVPDSLLWSIPWGHHALLLEKVKPLAARSWYMRQTVQNGWSRNVLRLMIPSDAYARQGKAISNFSRWPSFGRIYGGRAAGRAEYNGTRHRRGESGRIAIPAGRPLSHCPSLKGECPWMH